MLRNLFLRRPSMFSTFCKYLYWSPIPLSLTYFLEVKQISGQSMKVFISGWPTVYIFAHIQALSASQRSIPTHRHGMISAYSRGWLHNLNMSTTERILWRLGWVLKWRGAHSWSDWWIKRCPNDPNRVLIKRIIALEGDTVRIRSPCPELEIKIPQGHVWVEGMLYM